MKEQMIAKTKELIQFIASSPTAFHAVEEMAKTLQKAGFTPLSEAHPAELSLGGCYYLTRNGSSIIAFRLPESQPMGLLIAASHSDSPTFKLKHNYEIGTGGVLKLNTERYGGTILSTWFDRPLSIAGRAVVRTPDGIATKTVNIDRDLAIIPNVAIHQNRTINEGYKYNPACDTYPLIGAAESATKLAELVAAEAGCDQSDLMESDLYLYNRTPGSIFGLNEEFFARSLRRTEA